MDVLGLCPTDRSFLGMGSSAWVFALTGLGMACELVAIAIALDIREAVRNFKAWLQRGKPKVIPVVTAGGISAAGAVALKKRNGLGDAPTPNEVLTELRRELDELEERQHAAEKKLRDDLLADITQRETNVLGAISGVEASLGSRFSITEGRARRAAAWLVAGVILSGLANIVGSGFFC